jgi:hypothetical protein
MSAESEVGRKALRPNVLDSANAPAAELAGSVKKIL